MVYSRRFINTFGTRLSSLKSMCVHVKLSYNIRVGVFLFFKNIILFSRRDEGGSQWLRPRGACVSTVLSADKWAEFRRRDVTKYLPRIAGGTQGNAHSTRTAAISQSHNAAKMKAITFLATLTCILKVNSEKKNW